MRYGATPRNFGEWMAFRLGKVPVPILDVVLAPVQMRALVAAERAGVLRRLARGGATTSVLAKELSLDGECLRLTLRVLRSMGYAELSGERWELSAFGRRHFGERAEESYAAFVEYGAPQWEMIARLDDVLKTGEGVDFHDTQSEADWDSYQRAMFENARGFSWFVRENLPVASGARRCLDVAGSHGWVGVDLSRAHAGLRTTVLDRKEAIARAGPIADANGYGAEVDFEAFDLRKDEFPPGADVALLCNILHHFSADENRDTLKRLKRALAPGASVGVFEIETPADDAPPDAAGDGFALYFRITSTATCFRGDDYASWLTEAGFAEVRVVRSVRMPSRMLAIGRVA